MNKKLIAHILVITILIIVGAVVVSLTSQKPESTPPVVEDGNGTDVIIDNGKEPEVITSDIDTSDWLTYRNEEFGFEVKYPEIWEKFKESKNNQIIVTGSNCKGACAFISIGECNLDDKFLKGSIASVQGGEGGCSINLGTVINLKNDRCIFMNSHDPYIDISENKCSELIKSIDESRKSFHISAESAWLTEDEIPEEGQVAYNIFKAIVNSFKEL